MKYKVLVSDALSQKGLDILQASGAIDAVVKTGLSPQELCKEIKSYDGLLVRSGTKVTSEVIAAAKKLKVIGRAGVGVDNVDVETASKQGVIVMNAPSGNTLSTAELTCSMILSMARNIPQAHASMKAKRWDRKAFMGTEVFGKTLGIIGFGRIGREVAKRMTSFGMSIVVFDPFASADTADVLSVTLFENLHDLLKVADFITVHTPLTEDTKNILDAKAFKKMKKGVRLVNCARGGIINEHDLCDAIESGKVAAAAFDVYEQEPPQKSPLYQYEQVVMTPHLGASTREAQENVAVDVANQVVDMLLNGNVTNAVNFIQVAPEVYEQSKPYLQVAEKLGTLLSALQQGRYKELLVQYSGELARGPVGHLTIAVVKGLLKPFLGSSVNEVNATVLAQERGLQIVEEKTATSEDFANLIAVTLSSADQEPVKVAGTTFGTAAARIVRINGYHVDVEPRGHTLICQNVDKPGFVGKIGSVLGKSNVNIANMTLGRKQKGRYAVTVFNLDQTIDEKLLAKIRKVENIVSAVAVQF